jgi:two-component system sensor histidine kinase UhpB
MPNLRLLHVEDSADDAELVRLALENAPFTFELTRVDNEAAYREQLRDALPDAIICDYNLPGFSAERALEIIRAGDLDLPFIVVSHHLGETAAVVAMQNGASDYLPKRNLGRLAKAIAFAVDRCRARREKAKAEAALRESEAIRRGILDSLPWGIVLIDGTGVIVAVNKEWEGFEHARAFGDAGVAGPGANYLEALEDARRRGNASAGEVAAGVRSVIAREQTVFSVEYQVATGSGTRWFVARAMPLESSDAATVISHRDVTDRVLNRIALEDANKRLRGVSKRMLAVQEDERRAISRELHDDIGQTLGALKIGLHRLAAGGAAGGEALIAECLGAAGDAIDKLRQLAMDLRPPQLDQLGLKEALEWLAQRQSVASGLQVTCRFAGLETRLPAALESACYRITQEALNNATRHSKAKLITIGVESDGALLKLAVHDDGVGFDEGAARQRVARSGSMGLIGMDERAQLAGGRLKLRSVPGAGTTVSVIFPLVARVAHDSAAQAVHADA